MIASLLLANCTHYEFLPPAAPPADETTRCVPLGVFTGKTANQLVAYTAGLQYEYQICKARHDALVDTVVGAK